MTTTKNEKIFNALEQFHTELKSYESLLKHLVSGKMILGHEIRERDELRERLVRTTGMLKQRIIELTGKQYFIQSNIKYDVWSEAFNPATYLPSMSNLTAVAFCINTTNEAIGRLESDIQKGIRDKQTGELLTKSGISGSKPSEALTTKENWKAIENEFGITKNGFGRKINFVTDSFKRKIIFRDVKDACELASLGYAKPAVLLAGGVIEELLRLYLVHKGFSPPDNTLDSYIKTCEKNGLFRTGVAPLSDSLRQFRNLVHLSREKASKYSISKATAKGAVSSIFTIANDF